MERMEISIRSLGGVGQGVRRRRQLSLDQEQAAIETIGGPPGEPGLSAHVPSPLIPTEKRMAALVVGGAPAWSRRLRRIDTLVDAAIAELDAHWRRLARTHGASPASFRAAWLQHVAEVEYAHINDLIRRHNLYFPAEASLAMDVRTGDFIGPGGGDYRRPFLDRAWILATFPADLRAALT